ncbi:MAG: nuclear transport factor 2 family protein [Cyclobacteriaceae bacterium]
MKQIMLIGVLLVSLHCFSQSLSGSTESIKKVNDVYTRAVTTSDSVLLKSVLAENIVITGGNGVQRNRKQELADLILPGTTIQYFRIENEKYFMYDECAVVTGVLSWKMTNASGQEAEFRRVFTFTYAKLKKEWKIIAQHIGRMPV